MAVEIIWDNEARTILRIYYSGTWNWEEFDVAQATLLTVLDTVQHPVDLLLDVSSGAFPPPGAMTRFQRAATTHHVNIRHVVFVGPRPIVNFMQSMVRIMTALYGRHFTPPTFIFVASLEQGYAMIERLENERLGIGREEVPTEPSRFQFFAGLLHRDTDRDGERRHPRPGRSTPTDAAGSEAKNAGSR